MLTVLLVLLLAYLLGSLPTALVVGKLMRGIDIRQHGSGNAGGTNVFRVLGWKPGLFVMLVDAFKGFVAAYWLIKVRGLPENSVGFALLRGVLCWSCLIAILGFGARHLRTSNRFLKYANEAVLPFYVLHQTVILAIGFHVIRLDVPLWVEYLIIVTSSFAATIALYELLIRRITVLRFLFGLKPR